MLKPRRTTPVAIPVQVIRPLDDRFLEAHTLDGIERFAPSLTLRTVPGGHWAPRTCPERLAELIAEHVERAEAPGAPRARAGLRVAAAAEVPGR